MNARLPDDPIPTRWCVVKSKPRAEREAAEQLTRQDYRVVLPELIQPRKRWEALFPSYLFVQPADETHSIAPVRSTLGVSQLVRLRPTHATVPDQVEQDSVAIARLCTQCHEAEGHGLTAGTPVMNV